MIDFNQIQQNANVGFKFTNSSVGQIIKDTIPYIFSAAGIAVLIYLIVAGLQLMTSAGDPKAVESAKGKVTGALIGFVVIFASYWIVQLLSAFLGVDRVGEPFN